MSNDKTPIAPETPASDGAAPETSPEVTYLEERLKFIADTGALELELERARAVKREDPVRWAAAKQAWAEPQTYWRQISEYLDAVESASDPTAPESPATPTSETTIAAETIEVGNTTIAVSGGQ